jgi:multiple sugar transport system permease protein
MADAAAAPVRRRRRRGDYARSSAKHTILVVLSVIFAIPFLWMLSTSLKPDDQLFVIPPKWIPEPFQWSNYPDATNYIPYFRYFANTMYIALFNVVATALSCSLIAYGFSRIKWPGRDAVFILVLATLMIPAEVLLIPQYVLFRDIGWLNSFNPLTIPALAGSPIYVFLLRQFYLTIPFELSAAAKVDGANEFQIYLRIILPLSKAALAAVSVLTFVSQWNSFLGPLIYLNDSKMYTLALGMNSFFGAHGAEWSLLMAAATIMVVPVIVLFFISQRSFVEGITMTGSKG